MTAQIFSNLSDPQVAQLLSQGAVGVIPTDTVYGLVAHAQSRSAVERLYSLKPRELAPGTIIGASIEQLTELGLDTPSLDKIRHLWPAPLSVVIDAQASPPYLRQARTTLPVRIPALVEIIQLLEQTGPLMTTSANTSGSPTSTSVQMAIDYFGDQVDFYVDGGDLGSRLSSTIIGFNDNGEIVLYRRGAIEINNVLSKIQHGTGIN